ncbi:hypothetical protein MVEN_01594900 [Mycena venus]|uniref:Uncharacterized protein n=1 Tax=Mycena venus TaxID=2733690 RepID=A0A8H7CRN7_9AGAR|nr:hypothetical protein MVEN_01594900 [Mycena venus]
MRFNRFLSALLLDSVSRLAAASPCLLPTCIDEMNSTQSFSTPEDSQLPEGTFIATGVGGVVQLAEYIDEHPDTTIKHLLISDSTVHDTETRHGYLSFDLWNDPEDNHWGQSRTQRQLTDEEEDQQEDIRHSNAKTHIRLKRAVRDIEAPLTRVLNRIAPGLQSLAFFTYISSPSPLWAEQVDPRIAALTGRTYPSLTRLSFLNKDVRGPIRALDNDRGQFPALTHLHVVYGYDDAAPSPCEFCPTLP